MTIRELIKNKQDEILEGDLLPGRASEILIELSALLGNINDEIRTRDVLYSKVLLGFLESEEKANRAKIKAETTEEYENKCRARDAKELALELIRGLKYYLRAKDEEYKHGKNF